MELGNVLGIAIVLGSMTAGAMVVKHYDQGDKTGLALIGLIGVVSIVSVIAVINYT